METKIVFKPSVLIMMMLFILSGCSGFQASRVDSDESDEKAMGITDEWLQRDTEKVIDEVMTSMNEHRGFKNHLRRLGRTPVVFVGEVKNMTSEAYFPISEINNELLTELSASGDFILVTSPPVRPSWMRLHIKMMEWLIPTRPSKLDDKRELT